MADDAGVPGTEPPQDSQAEADRLVFEATAAINALSQLEDQSQVQLEAIVQAFSQLKQSKQRYEYKQNTAGQTKKEEDVPDAEESAAEEHAAEEEEPAPDMLDEVLEELDKPLLGTLLDKASSDDPNVYSDRIADIRYVLACLVLLLLYIFLFALGFMWMEAEQEWSLIDSWYFAVVTIGTVGYGVLTPSNDMTRMFVVIFLTLGFVFSTFAISILTEYILKKVEAVTYGLELHKNKFVPCGPRVLGMIGLLLLTVSIGTIYGVVSEEWDFVVSLYWTVVTMTTVGYGDFAPDGQVNRLVISFYIILSTGIFASLVAAIVASYLTMRKRAQTLKFILRDLEASHFDVMDKDNDGEITQKEFLEYHMVELGYTDIWCVNMINDVFNHLDVDGSGSLDPKDMLAGRSKQLIDQIRERHGVQEWDEHEVPVGIFGLKLQFDRGAEQIPHLWEGTPFPEGTRLIHQDHGHGVVQAIDAPGSRVVRFSSGVEESFEKSSWADFEVVRASEPNSPVSE